MAARNIEAYDKAVELYESMHKACNGFDGHSERSAIVAVKEIIDVLTHPIDGRKYHACKFWEEVLEELNQF